MPATWNAIVCPHCEEAPGNETAMFLSDAADVAAGWECDNCGEPFNEPKIIEFARNGGDDNE